jgi:hypothetical protein
LDPADLPDHSHMEATLERFLSTLVSDWARISAAQKADLVELVRRIAADGRLDDLLGLRVDTADAQEALLGAMTELGAVAANQVVMEADRQGVELAAVQPPAQDLSDVATVVAALLGAELVVSASRAAMAANRPGASADAIASAVREHLGSLSGANAEKQLGGALHGTMNAARAATLSAASVGSVYASEVMDRNTCGPCRRINGRWLGNTTDMAQITRSYPSGAYGGYIDCEGGVRCRGTIVGVWRPDQVGPDGDAAG